VTNFLSEPGFCLTPVTPHTLFLTRKKTGLSPSHQELTGSPRFLCASPHTCHALMTPAVPPESRQKISDSFVSASVTLKTWPTAPMPVTTLFHASGVRLTPCGPHDSLCTLRAGRSSVCLSFPFTQHPVRVVGQTFPGRDFHPAGSTKLCLAL